MTKATSTSVSPAWVPAIDRHFRFQWEPAQNAYVLLYPEGMVKLNESAGEILSRVDGSKTIAQIIDDLKQKFPDATGIDQDVIAFFDDAFKQRWLTHDK